MPRIPVPQVQQNVSAGGPLQQPVGSTVPLQDYASQADQSLADTAQHGANVFEKIEDDQARTEAYKTYNEFALSEDQNLKDGQQNAKPGAAGFTKDYLQSFDENSQNVIDSATSRRARRYLALHVNDLRTQMGKQAVAFEGQQQYAQKENNVLDSNQAIGQLIYQDPTRYEQKLQEGMDQIDSLNMIPSFKDKAKRELLKNSTENYWASKTISDPAGTAAALRPGVPLSAQPAGTIPQKIIAAANDTKGVVPPQYALAIAQLESKMNPNAQNGSSTGLFQLQPDTAAYYGVAKEDLKDPDQNIKGGIPNLVDNTKAFKSTMGRNPSLPELYGMHLLGMGAGMALAKAPDNMSFDALAHQQYASTEKKHPGFIANLESGNRLQNLTVGQVKATLSGWMTKASADTAGLANAPDTSQSDQMGPPSPNPALDNLTLPDRMKWLTHAESLMRRDDSQAKIAMTAQVRDFTAAASQFQDAPRPDPVEVLKTFGPVEGPQINRHLDNMQAFAAKGAGMATQSYDQKQQALAQAIPTPGVEGYADKLQQFKDLQAVSDKIDAARKANYVGFDQTMGARLTKNIDWSAPDAFSGPLHARAISAGQLAQDFRLPFNPWTPQDINSLGQMLDKAPNNQAGDILKQITGAMDSPEHAQQAIAQLAPNHPVLAVAGTLPNIGYAGVANPAQYVIAGDRILNPTKGDKAEEGKAPKIEMPSDKTGGFRDRWDQTVGPAFAGWGDKSSDQYLNAAIAYYIGKQDPAKRSKNLDTTLWKEAVQTVATNVDWNGAKVLVPHGTYADDFRKNIADVWPTVMQKYGLDPAEHNALSYPLQATPDGMYAVTNGTTALWGKNGYPVKFGLDGSVPNMASAPVEPTPPVAQQLPPKKHVDMTPAIRKGIR